MDPHEAREVGAVVGDGLREVTRGIGTVHRGIADTTHRLVARGTGGASTPVARAERLIATGAYAVTGTLLGQGARAAARLAAARAARRAAERQREQAASSVASTTSEHPSLHDHPALANVAAFYAGLHGHTLDERSSPLALRMHLRHDGRVVPLTPEGLAAAYGGSGDAAASRAIAVFVHGYVETELAWRRPAPRADRQAAEASDGAESPVLPTLPENLRDALGLQPVLVRFNSGLAVDTNGELLAGLLARLVELWPGGPPQRIVLVAHSMGGLVVDAAMRDNEGPWELVSDVAFLGTPWDGNPWSRLTGRVAPRLASSEVGSARWLGEVLESRSTGVRDLARRARPAPEPSDAPRRPRRHLVAGRLGTRDGASSHRLLDLVGDGVVTVAGATGDTAYDAAHDDIVVVPRTGHLALLSSPAVGAHLVRVLGPRPAS